MGYVILSWHSLSLPYNYNTKKTYGKPNEQLSPKRWSLSYLKLTKYHLDTQKVKTVQKLTPKHANTENHISETPPWNGLGRLLLKNTQVVIMSE